MKYKFRYHCGSIEESVKSIKVFDSLEDLCSEIITRYSSTFDHLDLSNIKIGPNAFHDDKLDWDNCHHVSITKSPNSTCTIGEVCFIDE